MAKKPRRRYNDGTYKHNWEWTSLHLHVAIALGLFAYALFFAYDWLNVRHPSIRVAGVLFPAGVALVFLSTAILLMNSPVENPFALNFIIGIIAAGFLLMAIVWSVFLSLPKGTYADPGHRRPVYEGGVYGLCRHPGVFFYCCFYLALLVALPSFANALGFAVLCLGNVAYMLLQDAWTFPAMLLGYEDYKQRSNMFFPKLVGSRTAGIR